MTVAEYNLRMDAAILRKADRLQELAESAFFQRGVEQVKENGVYQVQKVKDLYDITEVERRVFGERIDSDALRRLHEVHRRAKAWEEQANG